MPSEYNSYENWASVVQQMANCILKNYHIKTSNINHIYIITITSFNFPVQMKIGD